MITGKAIITIELDGNYTTQVWSVADGQTREEPLSEPATNQSLATAINKGRDDLAGLATGPLKHRRVVITTTIW